MMGWIDYLLDLLFPPKCLLCNRVLEKDQLDLCGECRVQQPLHPVSKNKFTFIDSWLALWYYKDEARQSLLRYKFQGKRCYAAGYGRLLSMKVQQEMDGKFDLITWVPVSKARRFNRGYDQVELLAKAVSAELNVPCEDCLRKIRNNKPQSGIVGQAKRRANVLGVYKPIDKAVIAGKRILLMDDIITTGATAGECARVLLTAGAREVHVAVLGAAQDQDKS